MAEAIALERESISPSAAYMQDVLIAVQGLIRQGNAMGLESQGSDTGVDYIRRRALIGELGKLEAFASRRM